MALCRLLLLVSDTSGCHQGHGEVPIRGLAEEAAMMVHPDAVIATVAGQSESSPPTCMPHS